MKKLTTIIVLNNKLDFDSCFKVRIILQILYKCVILYVHILFKFTTDMRDHMEFQVIER